MTLNELVKLTTLWTTGPWFFRIIDPILRFFRVTDKASLAETNYSGSENFDTLAIYSFVYDFITLKVIPCRINLRTIKMKLCLWVSKLCKFEQLMIQKLSLYYCVANSIYYYCNLKKKKKKEMQNLIYIKLHVQIISIFFVFKIRIFIKCRLIFPELFKNMKKIGSYCQNIRGVQKYQYTSIPQYFFGVVCTVVHLPVLRYSDDSTFIFYYNTYIT